MRGVFPGWGLQRYLGGLNSVPVAAGGGGGGPPTLLSRGRESV